MITNELIGHNLKRKREAMNLTQQQVATLLGLKREQVSFYENGHRTVSTSLLQKFAGIYDCKITDLLNESEYNKINPVSLAFRANEEINDFDLEVIMNAKKLLVTFNKLKTL
ncbi:hypothetical protein BBI11_00680 [Planococcus maritimus]|uniref:helix-turn-helix domain-containing protein n=1 Tax=Planococcus maritimus TaxID=192421 RepID=UPI00080F341A|nr:helix-turn-helix transcriptional regulator [Planococcus maritimus]ANU15694.1 hypothetical protein BBI11_00680 [Planococcus maritimus]